MSNLKLVPPRKSCHLLILVVLAAATGAACRSTTGANAPVSPDTWAIVNGRSISRDEVDRAFKRIQDATQALSEEEALTAKLNVLNDLIIQDLLLARAATLKLEVAKADLDKAYFDAKQNVTDEVFQEELKRRGVTQDELREGLRRELLAQKVIEQEVNAKVSVSDQEVADYFNANRAQFNVAEEAYHLAQIAITPTKEPEGTNRTGDDATSPQAAVTKAQTLMDRLKSGAAFEELAASYSEDPESAPRGGDLGFVPVSRLKTAPQALQNAVFNKAPGTVTVVSANGGHTLVLVVAHEMAGQRDLSTPEVKERITAALRGRKEQLLRSAYLTATQTDADIVNYLARRVVESQGKMPGTPATAAPK